MNTLSRIRLKFPDRTLSSSNETFYKCFLITHSTKMEETNMQNEGKGSGWGSSVKAQLHFVWISELKSGE